MKGWKGWKRQELDGWRGWMERMDGKTKEILEIKKGPSQN